MPKVQFPYTLRQETDVSTMPNTHTSLVVALGDSKININMYKICVVLVLIMLARP